jgi:DNA-directed RNA polymerase specialized sigma24 family protein
MDQYEQRKYDLAQAHRRLLIYRLSSRYPFIHKDTMLDLYNDVIFSFIRRFDNARLEQGSVVYAYLHTSLRNAVYTYMRDNKDVLTRLELVSIEDILQDNGDDDEGEGQDYIEALVIRPFSEEEDISYAEYIYQLILQGLPLTLRVMAHRYYIEEISLMDIMKELQLSNIWKATRMLKRTRKLLAIRLMEIKQLRRDGVLL